jgi:hypothetical protein
MIDAPHVARHIGVLIRIAMKIAAQSIDYN